AKNLPFLRMLLSRVRYEGTPGLWHVLLWVLSHSGLPYASMSWLSWAIAVSGTWMFVFYSPFPFFLRTLVPFTFFLCYQFAVVARSYVLIPLLIFLAAHLIRSGRDKPLLFAVVIGALANSSTFGCFISAGMACVYVQSYLASRGPGSWRGRHL